MPSVTLRTKPVKSKGYSLFLDIYNEGRRYKEYLKLYVSKDYCKKENKNISREDKDSWNLGNAIHAKRLLQIKESSSGFIPKINKQDFIKYFKDQAEKKNHPSYFAALLYLIQFNKSEVLFFKTVDENYLKLFISYLQEQDLASSTVSLYLDRINIILNLAVKDKIIQVNPFSYLKRGKGGDIPVVKRKKIEYLTLEELKKLKTIDCFKEIQQFFFFSCFTGLRDSDLRKLKWTDIEHKQLTYTQQKQRNAITHYLPMSQQALLLLNEIEVTQKQILQKKDPFVFAHIERKESVFRNLKSWAKKAGLRKNLHMHVGRHTFATLALTNNVSLYTVSKMLGHSSIAVTQVYAEIIDQVKQKAAEMMPLL